MPESAPAVNANGPIQPDGLAGLRRILRLVAIVLMLVVLFPWAWIPFLMGIHGPSRVLTQFFFARVSDIMGLRIHKIGAFSPAKPLLIISNHVSYLDIFAIGGLTRGAFTPKSEIAAWPVVGTLCRLIGCVFIDRRPRAVEEHRAELERRLAGGTRVILFPEGTTSDGSSTLPFRSAFFRMVEWQRERDGSLLPIQPIVLAYTHLDGIALTETTRPQVAWIGDADFAPHIWALMGHKNVDVTLTLLPSFLPEGDRKQLAAQCESQIGEVLASVASA